MRREPKVNFRVVNEPSERAVQNFIKKLLIMSDEYYNSNEKDNKNKEVA